MVIWLITPTYLDMVKKLLFEGEVVEFTARQRRIGPGGSIMDPSVVVATNERLLIVKDILMLHLHQDIDALTYSNITYTKMDRGIMSSTLVLGVMGYEAHSGMTSSSAIVEIQGLRHSDAVGLAQLIDKKIIKLRSGSRENVRGGEEREEVQEEAERPRKREEWQVVCKKCNAKSNFTARYCSNCGAAL